MLATSGRRATTIAGYRRICRVHVKPTLGDIQLQAITAVDLDRLYAQLASVGSPDGRGRLSKNTIRHVHVVIGRQPAVRTAMVGSTISRTDFRLWQQSAGGRTL